MVEGRRLWEGAGARVPAGLQACLIAISGCASVSPPADVDGFYRDSEIGYRVSFPAGQGSDWKWIGVDDAVLAFEQGSPEPGQRPAVMVFLLECGRGSDNLSIVARQLLIGIRDRTLRQAAPLALRGLPGWMQVFDTLQDGVLVTVKTISIRSEGCTFDWALVAPGSFSEVEEPFDAWWSSFERLPGESPGSDLPDSTGSTGSTESMDSPDSMTTTRSAGSAPRVWTPIRSRPPRAAQARS